MTKTNRPFAALFAAGICLLLWVPTLTVPAQAASSTIELVELA